ncbi:threonine/serine dehydratase [Hellea sp.]|mgnify:FL=1|jgi:threonine dehydratase|nr:threonine/serine dehydratase [Hellea sp.]MDB4844333.1 threonine/serine dehydratase [Hellea sp.]MDC1062115.1 threonine/serine dehydratase [Hellea sp.]MDC1089473.1 threonine/serine dehydratase [Hellea sp.]
MKNHYRKRRSFRPIFQDIVSAADLLNGNISPTPLIRSDVIDIITQKKVWFKPECNQKSGSFKYRGAFNRLANLSTVDKARGVVATSSGNHAQGIAKAAKELNIVSHIVMPSDAPIVKINGVKGDNGTIHFYNRYTESREEIAENLSKKYGYIYVPSFDDPYIIAGQGTIGLEIANSGINFDGLITCLGGGGLCAGISLAMKKLSPKTKIYGAEPFLYNDHQISLLSKKRKSVSIKHDTICDALMTPSPGKLTWPINKKSLSNVFTVTDNECRYSMAIFKKETGLQLEPGGAVALASLLKGDLSKYPNIKAICVILSGGNVDKSIARSADMALGL